MELSPLYHAILFALCIIGSAMTGFLCGYVRQTKKLKEVHNPKSTKPGPKSMLDDEETEPYVRDEISVESDDDTSTMDGETQPGTARQSTPPPGTHRLPERIWHACLHSGQQHRQRAGQEEEEERHSTRSFESATGGVRSDKSATS